MKGDLQMQNKLGNEQRKALEQLVHNSFDRKIQQQRELYNDAIARVTKQVKDEMGISAIEDQLKELKQKIADLESERERLGVNKYSEQIISGSKLKELIDQKTVAEKQAIKELETQMDKVISILWTSDDVSEVKAMIGDLVE